MKRPYSGLEAVVVPFHDSDVVRTSGGPCTMDWMAHTIIQVGNIKVCQEAYEGHEDYEETWNLEPND